MITVVFVCFVKSNSCASNVIPATRDSLTKKLSNFLYIRRGNLENSGNFVLKFSCTIFLLFLSIKIVMILGFFFNNHVFLLVFHVFMSFFKNIFNSMPACLLHDLRMDNFFIFYPLTPF